MNINRINALACFFLYTCFFSGVSYGHGTKSDGDNHQYEDAYIAAMVREEEARGTVVLKQYLGNLMSSKPVNRLLTEVVSAVVGEQVNAAVGGNAALYGEWSPLTTWPFAFASASNLPDGRILAWGGNHLRSFNGGTFTYAAIWDPATGQITSANHPTHSMFCGIPVMLEDGRIFVNGGDKANASSVKGTSTFNHLTQTWTRIQDMAVGRWYAGTVALPNGQVFTAAGEPGSKYPEIWTQGAGWSYLNGASLQTAILDYPTVTEPKNWLPHMHLAPNGKIFHSGHTPQMHYIDPQGNGSVSPVALTNDWNIANSSSVLFDEGKFLQVGGTLYDANNTSTTKSAVIDLNSSVPSRVPATDMHFPRVFHNQVVLPNGEVMVVGGNSTGAKFDDTGSQLTPEIWNPTTQTWRPVADIAVGRNYHSVALLMTDGRVWSGGGGLCNCSADHLDSQVFSPPYLFKPDGSLATRPQITDAPNLVSYGQTINVVATPGISKFSMVRMNGTTHALNSDMRLLNVPFVAANNGNYTLSLHTNRNVMVPGYWMLFALDGQGVPSVAKVIKVSTSGVPVIVNPGDQSTLVNTDVALNLQASDPNGDSLTFNATALPHGLIINASTGIISGKPTSVGSSNVVISVTDGISTATANFVWNIVSNQAPVASGVFGGAGGIAFTDNVAGNQFLTGISIYSGWWIDSIQGITNTGPLAKHGGGGGTLGNVAWPVDEYLVRIYGIRRTYVGQISFVTNTGRILGPYGSASGSGGGTNPTSFDYTVPVGNEIVGFTGRADGYLNAIGVLYRVRQIINQPPVVTPIAGPIQGVVGESVSLQVMASDPEGDALSYSAVGLPPGLTIGNAGLIGGTPTTAGNYDVIVTVQDAKGAESALNFEWSVNSPALVFSPLPSTSPQAVNTPVNMTASVSNGTGLQFQWSFGDGSQTTFSSTAATSHTYASPGLFAVQVTVKDSNNIQNTATFMQAIHLPPTADRPTQSGNMAVSTNRLWVVNQDRNTVTAFNTANNAKLAEISVGNSPRAIAISPVDGRVWVSNKAAATISVIDPTTLQVVQTINLPSDSQPFGLAFAPNGGAAYVALEAIGKLLKLNSSTGATMAPVGGVDVGPNPRHISITGDNGKIMVPRFVTKLLPGESTAVVDTTNQGGEVIVVDANTMAVNKTVVLKHSNIQDSENQGSGVPNYLAMAAIAPDGKYAWVPSKKDNIKRGVLRNGNNLNFQNTVRAISSKIDMGTLSETIADRIDFDNSGVASAAAFDLFGNYLFMALPTNREVAIFDYYGGHEAGPRIQVGRAPDGLAVSKDGKKLYVNNFMDRTVSVVDLTMLLSGVDSMPPITATLQSVATENLAANVLKGKQLFYDAKDLRLSSDGYMSCAACHNDGGHDGRVWDLTGFGEGLRNTIDLRGRGGMAQGLLHWTGNFDEVQDFEGQIRNLALGTGLMSDADFNVALNPMDALHPKAGKSADLDALAAYVASLNSFTTSPYRNPDGILTAEAEAGKALFNSSGCGQCHGGTQFTDSNLSGLPHDVGTITQPGSGKRLGATLTGLDTPTLRDVWNTAPYLHDGSAPTLNDAIRAHTNVTLSDADVAKVAAYVQQVGGSEPAPASTLLPDVVVTQLSYLNGTFTCTVINQGTAATPAGVTVGVGYFVDGISKTFGYKNVSLAAGASITIGTNGGKYTIPTGFHTITAYVDDVNRFAETDENNNQFLITVGGATDTQAPTVPTGLAATAVSPSQINLSWTASTDNVGVAGYRIFRGGTQVATVTTGTSYQDIGLTASTAYSYTISAYDVAGNVSAQSTGAGATTQAASASLPDVIVTQLTYNNGTFTSTVTNQGTAATPAGVTVGVGYFVDGISKTFGYKNVSIAAGASITIGTNGGKYTIPSGSHIITAYSDDVDRFPETDETNNQLSKTITVP